ncbi:hypothetical protein CCHL11_03713 [Colletotrichum chlorophyti]|uniref:Uncharacterized protein n=1 Tax=Colletotrichum chlorophyti TaxID=708187 RepID=A0A1Q8RSC3_9PEZI|nr:hypothetical protein CCHL11_03713 [Colletotrichum chlorophyti]
MRFTIPLALVALAAAVPTPEAPAADDASKLLASLSSKVLDHDDVVIYGVNGQYKIVKEAEFQDLVSTGVLTYGGENNNKTEARDLSEPRLEARACAGFNAEYQVTGTSDFLDWDVQISPVFGAQQAPVTIAIARGYQVTNSITVGGEAGISAEGLSAGLKIDFQRQWTTIDTTTVTYTVPTGYYGVVISQPWTHRIFGNVYTSCTTSNYVKSAFQGNTHTSQTYAGGLQWVTGVFRLCASKSYPIPYCEGSGYHH